MIQKKRGSVPASKKLNRIKSQEYMPIGSLMQEIGQLKEELIGIKKAKRRETVVSSNQPDKPTDNKENRLKIQFDQQTCSSFSRDVRLKVQILWGKICKSLESNSSAKSKMQIIELIELFNEEASDRCGAYERLNRQLHQLEIQRESQQREQSQKFRAIALNNNRLESEVEQLKASLCTVVKQKQAEFEEVCLELDQQTAIVTDLKSQIQELTKNNLQLESIIGQWELHSKNLQEKCAALQKNITGKDQEVKLMQDDVRYLRIESEKFKSQRKQFQKLWEKASVDLREFKRAFEEEVVKAQREKNKWMNECELRRHQSEQLQQLQTQKDVLLKEVQDLRNNYSLKCKELSDTKAHLHQIQRQLLALEGQNFRMATDLEKTRRQNQHWEREMVSLRKQFEDLHKIEFKPPKEKKGERTNKSEKKRALEDIHSLIRQFRSEDAV